MNGQLLQTLNLERSWFPPLTEDWDGKVSKPYPTMLKAIHQDRDGHLIVILERARPGFLSPATVPDREPTEPSSLTDHLEFMEQVIEVLDPSTGSLLGTVENRDTYLLYPLEDDRIVAIGSTADGAEFPIVYRLVHQ